MVQTDSWATIHCAVRQTEDQRSGSHSHSDSGATGIIVHGHDSGCPGEHKGITQGQMLEIGKMIPAIQGGYLPGGFLIIINRSDSGGWQSLSPKVECARGTCVSSALLSLPK